ncbi:c-type cytochrome [Myroides injenensis]|uniref:c-type cytochrome n=1 Tax=Myroides injenensis TaxID=1183151 RepID=UPI00028943B3|nr:c-type cytochrome [Myroides injenensis]
MTTTIRTTLLLLITLLMIACSKKENKGENQQELLQQQELSQTDKIALGKKLFEGKGNCKACHLLDKKVVGPSVKEIVAIYDKYGADIVTFLKGDGEPIVDPSQYIIMQANFAITKKMADIELESLVLYMRSM